MGPKRPLMRWCGFKRQWPKAAYIVHPHAHGRFGQRGLSMQDVRHAIANATSCTVYTGRAPIAGGTNWRVTGPDVARDEMTVGVEAFEDIGKRALLITVF